MEPGMLGTFQSRTSETSGSFRGVWQTWHRTEVRSGKAETHGIKRRREGDLGNNPWTRRGSLFQGVMGEEWSITRTSGLEKVLGDWVPSWASLLGKVWL